MTGSSAKQIVERFFRHESATVIAVQTRAFGIRRIQTIEDTVQAVMLDAMQAWPQCGLPDNPAAWIHHVARNRMIFACCHPSLDRKGQIALTLKTLCGCSIAEIAGTNAWRRDSDAAGKPQKRSAKSI